VLEIKVCKSSQDYKEALLVVKSYIEWLGIDLSFQSIDNELKEFSSIYGYPKGAFVLAKIDGKVAGGVGFKEFKSGICEIKRLYIYEEFRGKGIAKRVLKSALNLAKEYGYKSVYLDTLDYMREAITLYESFGFREIKPYYFNPLPNTKYFELKIDQLEHQ
jgi:GNAT superfamily N-acetyltransferase